MIALLLLWSCSGETIVPGPPPTPPLPPRELAQGPPWIAVGDPGPDRATIWAHTGVLTRARVEAWRLDDPTKAIQWRLGPLEPAAPPAAPTLQGELTGLPPGTAIGYRVLTGDGRQAEGRFRTAPAAESAVPLRLVVAGDLGGQGWCRPTGGYTILRSIAALDPDLLILNGDQVYVDSPCPAQAPDGGENLLPEGQTPVSVLDLDWTDATGLREGLDRTWAYHRGDPAFQELLATVPLVAQWDDHEVANDFGAPWPTWSTGGPERPGYPTLVAQGKAAFRAWNPISTPTIHRRLPLGARAELFIVDARSFRSENGQEDGLGKTLLGPEQLGWLRDGLRDSKALWKIVSVDVPMSIPTGSAAWKAGRDGWANGTGDPTVPEGEVDRSTATGFEAELGELLRAIHDAEVQGVIFVTTDVHHSRLIRYPNDGVPVHEVVSGPLRAWSGPPVDLDPSFSPESLWARGEVFSFAQLLVEADGGLRVELRGEDGALLPGGTLSLAAP